MDQMQGTTRIIYDTVNFNGIRSYDFFSEVASKQNTQPGGSGLISGQAATNITDNKFEPGEGMVIKEIALFKCLTDRRVLSDCTRNSISS